MLLRQRLHLLWVTPLRSALRPADRPAAVGHDGGEVDPGGADAAKQLARAGARAATADVREQMVLLDEGAHRHVKLAKLAAAARLPGQVVRVGVGVRVRARARARARATVRG